MEETLSLHGVLKGHGDWVTTIATTVKENTILTGSRDKTIVVWELTGASLGDYGFPKKSLQGHSHFVSDVVASSDGQFALSASWDNSLRLWDINTGTTSKIFTGHTDDVLSVAFSADNRQIVSGSRDRTIKLWNTLGECKWTIDASGQGHTGWVSSVSFSPNTASPSVVSGGWDHAVKVWNISTCKLKDNLIGHTGNVNAVNVSPDGSLCASGGKDGQATLWDLKEGKKLFSLDAGNEINDLIFSPNRYWLCAATTKNIIIWDLESKDEIARLDKGAPDFFVHQKAAITQDPSCLCLAWSRNGSILYAGYSDHNVRVWGVTQRH